ncbi:hypothetical protein BUALT_Bualt16G0098300 [Buddleja alternifolia]|uniref:Uncharacterized protein n=1 Tax=Buddleja alternifolia TaxID=168488 RepID=A0AAV6WJM7_9LAMI|nr:hypothetical protein BUALT_Bualt16G0098300 [Buddleja alternifolia]
MSETRDYISVRIDDMLSDFPTLHYKHSIFKVSDDLRYGNEKLYEPKILAIGPSHHGKNHLQKMEKHKLRYLKLLLKRNYESSVDRYVIAIRSLEKEALRCYAEPIELSSDDFVQMLLLDGIFVIEILRKYGLDYLRDSDDTIFQYEQVLSQIRHDLMLVENQVPFILLDQLFSMTKTGNPDDEILYLILLFIDDISPWPGASEITEKVSSKNVDHLLGLVYKIWSCSFANTTANRPNPVKTEEEKMVPINSTSELQVAGIKFAKYRESSYCLDIKFTKGVMKIPGFDVSDATESILRNLIAYEHFFIDNRPKYVTDYAFLLHCLINSSKDVEILRRRGIITNLLGDDEMVYLMFNRLGRNVLISSDFCYGDVFKKVDWHCGKRWNRWIANLRKNYFNSPWAIVSVFAALMLLLFTLTQTVFSVLSYTKTKS